MTATVHNIKREPLVTGSNVVYIGRARRFGVHFDGADGYFGNPYRIGPHGNGHYLSRKRAIAMFEVYARDRIARDPEYRRRVCDLDGKALYCYCAPLACHGDVLARLAGELVAKEQAS